MKSLRQLFSAARQSAGYQAERSEEVAEATAEFHRRTQNQFDRITDLEKLSEYAALRGWLDLAQALGKSGEESPPL